MMLKTAIMLALAVGAFATGCYYEEEYYCARKDYVSCGGEPCYGHCALDYKKSCDKKVGYKTVCEEENFCKEIEIPCGHGGLDPHGLYCSADEECVVDTECKLIPAVKKHSFAGWKTTPKANGFFEVCKDVYSCEEADPWDLDDDVIEVVCKKEYTIEEDMDCGLLTHKFAPEKKFFKMNPHFSCDKEIVGTIVCVEADAFIKVEKCADGSICEEGYECATRDICTQVPVAKPVCERVPYYTCLANGLGGGELCGNKYCSKSEKCEVFTNTVCPTIDPVVVHDPILVHDPVVVHDPIIPDVIPDVLPDVVVPVVADDVSTASSSSLSVVDEFGLLTETIADTTGNGRAVSDAVAAKGGSVAESLAKSRKANVVTRTTAIKGRGLLPGQDVEAFSEATHQSSDHGSNHG